VNKATLMQEASSYYPLSEDYYNYTKFLLKNDNPVILKNQYMEWKMGSGYLASEIMFPYDLSSLTAVEYRTTSDPTTIKIASGSQLKTLYTPGGEY
jgi:hypothetical protein